MERMAWGAMLEAPAAQPLVQQGQPPGDALPSQRGRRGQWQPRLADELKVGRRVIVGVHIDDHRASFPPAVAARERGLSVSWGIPNPGSTGSQYHRILSVQNRSAEH